MTEKVDRVIERVVEKPVIRKVVRIKYRNDPVVLAIVGGLGVLVGFLAGFLI